MWKGEISGSLIPSIRCLLVCREISFLTKGLIRKRNVKRMFFTKRTPYHLILKCVFFLIFFLTLSPLIHMYRGETET